MVGDSDSGEGLVFNLQRFSLHDGPGIRTTVFLKGCPLRCRWCCNPEAVRPFPEIITRNLRCIQAGRCVAACPQHAIAITDGARVIDWSRCDQCTRCAAACRTKAIDIAGTRMGVAEVLRTAAKDASYYRRTGGGITISGGEPLLQWRFALATLTACKQQGWHTALDTTGHADWNVLEPLLERTDLVLYDLKHTNTVRHREATGTGNEQIVANLRRLARQQDVKIWVRRAVIPGFNEDDDECVEFCRFVRTLGPGVEKVSLLPYHKFAEPKYAAMGRESPYAAIPLITAERMGALQSLVASYGLAVEVGR